MTIIYNSMAGTTKKYALLLQEKLNCNAVAFEEAEEIDDEVVFMSWVQLGEITKLNEARVKFNLKAVVAVGAMTFSEDSKDSLISKNNITEKFFLLPGTFSLNNLTGMYKMMMKMMFSMMKKEFENRKDAEAFKKFSNEGIDLFDPGKIDEIVKELEE